MPKSMSITEDYSRVSHHCWSEVAITSPNYWCTFKADARLERVDPQQEPHITARQLVSKALLDMKQIFDTLQGYGAHPHSQEVDSPSLSPGTLLAARLLAAKAKKAVRGPKVKSDLGDAVSVKKAAITDAKASARHEFNSSDAVLERGDLSFSPQYCVKSDSESREAPREVLRRSSTVKHQIRFSASKIVCTANRIKIVHSDYQ
ncbi:hypothetical protein BDR07DRAFT_1373629 [Suillus spraguei]|nr:hypothetical protein BDR07DRAFT_1373629 [Suillus spraguei]